MVTKPSSPKRITLTEIAERCDVSRQVVSAIVSGRQSGSVRYSDETRDRVLKVVRETGYRPNRTVMGFFQKRHGAIGVLAHDPYTIMQQTLASLMQAAREHDQLVTIEHLDDRHDPRMVIEDCVDGIVLFETVDKALMKQITHYRLPVVQVNTNTRFERACITYDEESAVQQAARLFAERGCKNPALAVVAGAPQHYSEEVRRHSFAAAALREGLAAPIPVSAPVLHAPEPPEKIRAMLAEHPELDCILLYKDDHAPAVIDACHALGRRIPEDIALISFNDSVIARSVRPALASFAVNYSELGRLAVTMLNDLLNGEDPEPLVMPYTLQRRDSV